jgi:hypothetical protein
MHGYDEPVYLIKSSDTGVNWQNTTITGLSNNMIYSVMGFSIDINTPTTNRTLYVTINQDVYKSTDDGDNWQLVFDCNGCRFTAVDRFNSNTVYAAGESGLWRSNNGGVSWTNITHPEMTNNGFSYWEHEEYQGIFDIQTDPNQPGIVYVTVLGHGKGLYKSSDNGNTWTKILTDNYLRKVGIVPNNSDYLYATSSSAFMSGGYANGSNGIWFSTDAGQTWSQQNQNMDFPFATTISISHSAQPVVFIGSPGTGFQKSIVPGISVIEKTTQTNKIKVYPNPADNKVFINTFFNTNKISIYHLTGQDVTSLTQMKTLSDNLSILDVSKLKPGIYFIRLDDISTVFVINR